LNSAFSIGRAIIRIECINDDFLISRKEMEIKMKKEAVLAAGMAVVMMLLLACSSVVAQDALDYSWGTVVEAADGKIVLEEYDYETEGTTQITYLVSSELTIENAASLEEIVPGDDVEVGFTVDGLNKTAVTLYVEKDSSVGTEEE